MASVGRRGRDRGALPRCHRRHLVGHAGPAGREERLLPPPDEPGRAGHQGRGSRHKEALLRGDPGTYFTTPHYEGSSHVLVRLEAIDEDELAEPDRGRLAADRPSRLLCRVRRGPIGNYAGQDALPPDHPRGPRLRLLPGRRHRRGRRRGGRPAVGHRALPAAGRLHGVRIEHVLETHNHADHVSGHGRLARATGATIHIHELAEAEYPHEAFADGWTLDLGERRDRGDPHARPPARAHLLPAPRRRPRRRSLGGADRRLAVRRRRRPPGPRGRAARGRRRDLPLPARAAAGPARRGRGLARAPRRLALRQLRDRPQVLLDDRLRARATTAPSRFESEAEFVEDAVATLGDAPPNVEHIVALNRGPLVEELGTPAPLTPRAVEVGDRRGRARWSTPAPTSSSTRPTSPARSAPPPTTPASRPRSRRSSRPTSELIVVAASDGYELEAAELLASVGLRVRGFLEGGMTAWRSEEPAGAADRADRPGRAGGAAGATATRSCPRRPRRRRVRRGPHPRLAPHPLRRASASGSASCRATARSRRSAAAASAAAWPPRSCSARASSEVLHVAHGGVGTWRRSRAPGRERLTADGRRTQTRNFEPTAGF